MLRHFKCFMLVLKAKPFITYGPLQDGEGEVGEEGNVKEEEADDPIGMLGGVKASVSKGEVARMIRGGVSAMFEAGKGELTDDDLDIILGRKEGTLSVVESNEEEDNVIQMENVGLRELDGVTYEKEKEKTGDTKLEDLIIDEPRQRKKRIVMVDGKGTGYGGQVPMLAEELSREDDEKVRLNLVRGVWKWGGIDLDVVICIISCAYFSPFLPTRWTSRKIILSEPLTPSSIRTHAYGVKKLYLLRQRRGKTICFVAIVLGCSITRAFRSFLVER